jgi:hypothetical protein
MNIEIHIERLVLDGLAVSRADAPLVQAAVEAELSRLLTNGALAPNLLAGGAVPRLRAAAIPAPHGGEPTGLGTQIARSVYGGISK